MHCIVLYCIVLYCIVFYPIIEYLQHNIIQYNVRDYTFYRGNNFILNSEVWNTNTSIKWIEIKKNRYKNWTVLRFLVLCFTILSRNLLACLSSLLLAFLPTSGAKIARARTSWRESRVEYYPLHTAAAFLVSDWLYFFSIVLYRSASHKVKQLSKKYRRNINSIGKQYQIALRVRCPWNVSVTLVFICL